MLVITTKSQNFRNKGDLSSSLISLSMHLGQLNANKEASNEKFFCNYILSLLLLSLFIPATETFSQNFQGSLLPQGHLQMLYFVETFISNSTDLEHVSHPERPIIQLVLQMWGVIQDSIRVTQFGYWDMLSSRLQSKGTTWHWEGNLCNSQAARGGINGDR